MSAHVPHPDRAALYEELVACHGASIWRLAFRLTGDADDAEDLAQEVFFEAWRSIGTLRSPPAARAWLVSILVHRGARRWRTTRRSPARERAVDPDLDGAPEELSGLALGERQEEIQRALDALAPERRTVFLLVFLEGLTCREAAELLDIPLGTALSRIHRARAELRRSLRALAPRDEAQDQERGRA